MAKPVVMMAAMSYSTCLPFMLSIMYTVVPGGIPAPWLLAARSKLGMLDASLGSRPSMTVAVLRIMYVWCSGE